MTDVKVAVSVDMGSEDNSLKELIKQLGLVTAAVTTTNKALTSATSIFGKYQQNVKEATRVLGKLIGAQKLVTSTAGTSSNASNAQRALDQIAAMERKATQAKEAATRTAAASQDRIRQDQLKLQIAAINRAAAAERAALSEIARVKNQNNNLALAQIKREELATAKALKASRDIHFTRRGNEYMAANAAGIRAENAELSKQKNFLNSISNIHDNILSHIFGVVAGYRLINAAINTMLNTLRSVPKALIELQTTKSVFAATFDSQFAGASVMTALDEEAQRTGISITTLRENFRNLNASMSIAGETTQDVWKVFTNMNTAITALHLSSDSAVGIFQALQQTFNKGKVQSEELTKQLGNRLPGAFAAFAKATGRSTATLAADMKAGLVQAHGELVKFAEFYGSTFSKSMVIAGEGLQSNLGRLTTSFTHLAETIGVMLEEPMIKTVNLATGVIDSIRGMLKGSKELTVALNAGLGLAFVVAGHKLALFLEFMLGVVPAAAGATAALGATSRAMTLLKVSMAFLLSPAGLVTAIGLVAGAIYGLKKAGEETNDVFARGEKAINDYIERIRVATTGNSEQTKELQLSIQNDPFIQEQLGLLKEYEVKLNEAKAARAKFGEVAVGAASKASQAQANILQADIDKAEAAIFASKDAIARHTAGIGRDLATKEKKLQADKLAATKDAGVRQTDATVSATQSMLAQVKALYDNNKLSIQTYYSELNILQSRAFDERLDQLRGQLAKQRDLIKKAPEGSPARETLANQSNSLKVKISNLEAEKSAKELKTAGQRDTAQRQFNESLIASSQAYYTLTGSAKLAAEAQNKLLDSRLDKLYAEAFAGKNKELTLFAIGQLEYTKANNVAQAELTDSIRNTTIAEQALNNATTRTNADVDAGTKTNLQGMLDKTVAAEAYIATQTKIIANAETEYNRTTDVNGNIRRSIDEMTASLYAFQQTSNEVVVFTRTTLNDALSSSFKDFITGAKSAGEAMKDFALTVIDSLAQIAAQQLASQILGSLFSAVGSTSIAGLGTAATTQISGSASLSSLDIGSLIGVTPFAKGGIPDIGSSPATFPMGSLREGGKPEVIMPIKRDSKGNMGVSASNVGGGGISIGTISVSVVEKEGSSAQDQGEIISKAIGNQLRALVQQGIAKASRPGNQLNPTQITGVF